MTNWRAVATISVGWPESLSKLLKSSGSTKFIEFDRYSIHVLQMHPLLKGTVGLNAEIVVIHHGMSTCHYVDDQTVVGSPRCMRAPCLMLRVGHIPTSIKSGKDGPGETGGNCEACKDTRRESRENGRLESREPGIVPGM